MAVFLFHPITAIAVVACMLGGVVVFLRGWRGRRVGDHPYCAKCGFDLFGAPAGGEKCPECGAVLSAPRSTVTGERVRRRGPLAVGIILLVIGCSLATFLLADISAHLDWNRLRPTWYAIREADGSFPGSRSDAINVLLKRADENSLSTPTRARLATALIAIQADPRIPWNTAWGRWLADEIFDGKLPPAERDAFLKAVCANQSLNVRPTIRAGDELPCEAVVNFVGRGIGSQVNSKVYPGLVGVLLDTDVQIVVDGQPLPAQSGYGSMKVSLAGSRLTWTQASVLPPSMKVGDHEIEVNATLRIRSSFDKDAPDVCTVPVNAKANFSVVAGDVPIKHVADPSMRNGFQQVFFAPAIQIELTKSGRSGSVEFDLDQLGAPMTTAFDILARQGEHDVHIGSLTIRPTGHSIGSISSTSRFGFDSTGLHAGRTDLHLIPSDKAARDTIDITDIWEGEIVIRDVPVIQK